MPSSSLRTFLIADVRSYTRYTAEHGDEAAGEVASRFAELARQGIAEGGGELVELRGDEALGVFGSARNALRAAVELQRLFRSGGEKETSFPLGVGIGLDAGEAVSVEGGYRGGALNLAARLCSTAAAGEILASDTVVALARQIEGMQFASRGTKRLKGLESPVEIFEVIPMERLGPVPAERLTSLRRFRRRHLTTRTALAGALVALVAAAVAAGVLVVTGGDPGSSASAATRVGLVVPRSEVASNDVLAPYVQGLIRARQAYGIDAETLTADVSKPLQLERVRGRLDDFDLVLVAGTSAQKALQEEIVLHPGTRFLFLDPHLFGDAEFTKSPNYTDIFYQEGPGAYLAGALSALMAKKRAGSGGPGIVSIVAGDAEVSENQVKGFLEGVSATVPLTQILIDYSHDFSNPSVCDVIANRQIDEGSQVVFTAAGECSLGALSAAGLRGVWGVGSDVDRSYLGPHVLASVMKRRDQAVDWAVRSFLDGTLPQGKLDVGIERDLVDLVGISRDVPPGVLRKLATVKRQQMRLFVSLATPLSKGAETTPAIDQVDQALAESSLLHLSDFPRGSRAIAAAETVSQGCFAPDFAGVTPTGRAVSGDFLSVSAPPRVGSVTGVYETAAAAEKVFSQVADGTLADCIASNLKEQLEKNGFKVTGAEAGRLSFPALGDESDARQIAIVLEGQSAPSIYVDLVGIRTGRVFSLLLFGANSPVSPDQEVELARTVESRMSGG